MIGISDSCRSGRRAETREIEREHERREHETARESSRRKWEEAPAVESRAFQKILFDQAETTRGSMARSAQRTGYFETAASIIGAIGLIVALLIATRGSSPVINNIVPTAESVQTVIVEVTSTPISQPTPDTSADQP